MINEIDTLNSLLNADMSKVDTDFPVMVAGPMDFVIAELKVNDSKKKEGAKTLEITLKTALPTTTKNGRPLNPGFPLRHYIGLTATEKYNPLEQLAALKEAVFGDKNANVQTTDFLNKPVTGMVAIESTPEFGERNRIARFIKKAV